MCSKAGLSVCIVAVCLGVGGLASTAAGQNLRDLARRLDSTKLLATEGRRELNAYDRARPPALVRWTDTMVIASGKVTVYFNRDAAQIATASATRADSHFRRLGGATATFPPVMFSVRRDSTRMLDRRQPVIVGYHPPGGGSINRGAPDVRAIAKVIVDQTVDVAADRKPSAFWKWRRGAIPLDPADIAAAPDWGALRLDLISSPSRLGKRCYGGDVDDCAMFLGLRSVEDPVMAWYDSLARVNQVNANRDLAYRNQSAATTRCLAGSDTDCGAALRAMDHYIEPPGNDSARATIMRQAIAMGGERAAERLLINGGSPSDALAVAANAPIESVIRAWQRNIRDQAVGSQDLSPRLALIAILWVAVLAAVALRSSRWP